MRFIHSSDWQLGMTRHFLTGEAAARYTQARIDAVRRLGELAREHAADFIVVAGDVFESNQLAGTTLARALAAVNDLPVPTFLLPGNHDPLDGASLFLSHGFEAGAGAHIHVLKSAEPIAVPGLSAVEVAGAPWLSKRPDGDLAAEALATLKPAAGLTRVFVAHGQVDDLAPDRDQPGVISRAALEAAIDSGRVHFVALGDRHSLTSVGSTGRIWYSGTPLMTDFDEIAPNEALLVELVGGQCETRSLTVGDWRFEARDFPIDTVEDVEALSAWLAGLDRKERCVLKVGLSGTVSLGLAARIDALFETQAPLFASLRRRARTSELVVIPDSVDSDTLGLAGYASSAWEELAEAARRGDETAADALRLCYRLALRGAR